MPTAVVTSVHPFGTGLVVGSHQIARELARRGWRVALLSDPASAAHVLGAVWRPTARARVCAALRGPQWVEGMVTLTPFTALPLARDCGAGWTAMLHRWARWSLPSLNRFLVEAGLNDADLAIFDSPITAVLRPQLRPRRTVLRLFDDTSEEPPWPRALAALAGQLAASADLVAITAPSLERHATALGARRVHLMPNGADVDHFATPAPEPDDLALLPRPRVVYLGALAPWIHFTLMNEVAIRMPRASFIWIGPGTASAVVRRANVHVLGPRPYSLLPAYLQHCDVGVIPFDRDRHPRLVDSVHPLKLYDYLAAGLPVVATPSAELTRIAPPVQFAQTPEAFAEAIAHAASGGRVDARSFLASATWRARVDDLLAALYGRDAEPRQHRGL